MFRKLKALTFFLISLFAYLSFAGTLAYLVGFLLDSDFLPRTVDRGPGGSIWPAVAVDLALIALFGAQHSIMARPGFKAVWTRVVPPAIERSVYVLISSGVTIALCLFWMPIPYVVWSVETTWGYWLWIAGFTTGLIVQFVASFQIDHYSLLGLRQTWQLVRRGEEQPQQFLVQGLYRFVRHPIYVGWALLFWFAPTMTIGHLLLASGMTVYILIAIVFEETDLVEEFGQQYRSYQQAVPALLPRVVPVEGQRVEMDR